MNSEFKCVAKDLAFYSWIKRRNFEKRGIFMKCLDGCRITYANGRSISPRKGRRAGDGKKTKLKRPASRR